ncbi:HAD family hydrolase [Rhodopila globiformis]|nr:HAD-IA family hydrolase [Rhodopila globiformis]
MNLPLRLVIFDCDGVLIDSEALCDRVVSRDLHAAGWPLSPEECHRLFLGLTFPDIQRAAEKQLGRSLGPDWVSGVIQRVTAVMAEEVEPVAGAREALEATRDMGVPYRVASNSSRGEMAAKFTRTGLADLLKGRIHSAYDLLRLGKRGKPAPDLFLEAATAEGVAPAACLVVEDSLAGVRGAVAAGMPCLGYSPNGNGAQLSAAGALPFTSMFALPDLIRSYLHGTQ